MRTPSIIALTLLALLAVGVAKAQPSLQSPGLYFNHPRYTDVQ